MDKRILKRLIAVRKRLGLTQADVAEALGVSRDCICRMEIGKARFTLLRMIELAKLYQIDMSVLADDHPRELLQSAWGCPTWTVSYSGDY
jgi:transcriptional regulator with XRE-family HTH domain